MKTIYLEMSANPYKPEPPPCDGLMVIHAKQPTIKYYRYLYDAVGAKWDWQGRKRLSDDELTKIIHDPKDEVHVLFVDGVPAGFAELDRRQAPEIELVQFGLTPEFIGQGLGKYFLRWTIDKAWSYQPTRFWLHTCSLDSPAAIPNYVRAGFKIYKERTHERWE